VLAAATTRGEHGNRHRPVVVSRSGIAIGISIVSTGTVRGAGDGQPKQSLLLVRNRQEIGEEETVVYIEKKKKKNSI